MFINFFYILKSYGVPVAITEWMMLMEALGKGMAFSSLTGFYHVARSVLVKSETHYDRYDMAFSSLTGFYHLARSVLVKSETHYDRYDMAFYSYFRGVETPDELTEKVLEWLENALPPLRLSSDERKMIENWNIEDLRRRLEERLKEQKEEHHGGDRWVGTGGTSPFGHSGYHPAGIRIGGKALNSSAVQVAAQRNFRGFRADSTIGVRQFEIALRKLRQLSSRVEGPAEELDVDETVKETGQKGGILQLVWERSRKNTVKLALIMDSGGSMDPYMRLCSQLFTALNRSGHFKDLRYYYFHNCIYQHIYTDPSCLMSSSLKTEDFLNMLEPDYKVILLGDATMAPSELTMPDGSLDYYYRNDEPGIVWLNRIAKRFSHCVWLNPIPSSFWDRGTANFTISLIRDIFPMYDLSIEGLDEAIKKLKVRI